MADCVEYNGKKITKEEMIELIADGKFDSSKIISGIKNKNKIEVLKEEIKDLKGQVRDVFNAGVGALKAADKAYLSNAKDIKDAVKNATKIFDESLGKREISKAQYASIMSKVGEIASAKDSVKRESAIKDYVDHIDKISDVVSERAKFSDVNKARGLAKTALAKAKTFTEARDVNNVSSLLRINPKFIPEELFKEYSDIINTISDPKNLTNTDINSLRQRIDIINGVYNNDVVGNIENISSHLNENPELVGESLEVITKDMVNKDIIDKDQQKFILKNRELFEVKTKGEAKEGKAKKEPYTKEERSSIHDESMLSVNEYEENLKAGGRTSNINTEDRGVVDSVIDNFKKYGREWMDTLSDKELDSVNHTLKLMNNDLPTGDLNILIDRKINEFKKGKALDSQFVNIRRAINKVRDIAISSRGKSLFGNIGDFASGKSTKYKSKTAFEQAQRYQRYALDEIFETGNNTLKEVFVNENAQNFGKHKKYVENINNDYITPLKKAVSDLFKDRNKEVLFNTRVQMYLNQRRFNLKNDGQNLADLDQFVDVINNKNYYNDVDLKNINDLYNEFKDVGLENHEEFLNKLPKKELELAKKMIDGFDKLLNGEIKDKAIANAKYGIGKTLKTQDEGYFPSDLVYDNSSTISLQDEMVRGNEAMFNRTPDLKAGNLEEIKGSSGKGTNRIANLTDPFSTIEKYIESISLTYHNQENVIRTNNVIDNIMKSKDAKYNGQDKEFIELMQGMMSKSVQDMVGNSKGLSLMPPEIEKLLNTKIFTKTVGLAKTPSEFLGNMVNSVPHLKPFVMGFDLANKLQKNGFDLDKIVYNMGFSQTDRIVGTKSSSKESPLTDIPYSSKGDVAKKSLNPALNKGLSLFKKTRIGDASEKIDEFSKGFGYTPDKLAATYLSLGIFDAKFTKLTGEKIDWKKIEQGDIKYLDKYKEAKNSVIFEVNQAVAELIGTKNPYEVPSNNQIDLNDKIHRKLFTRFNSFMTSFQKANATASYVATKKAQLGTDTWGNAAGVFGSRVASQVVYMKVYAGISGLLVSGAAGLMGYKVFKDDEDDEKSLVRSIASSVVQVPLGASGNFTKSFFNLGFAYAEDAFGQGITRSGIMNRNTSVNFTKYDPNKSVWDNVSETTLSNKGELGIADSDIKTLKDDVSNHNWGGIAYDVTSAKVPLFFTKDINNIRSALKYALPSKEAQRDVYAENNQEEIKNLEKTVLRYAIVNFKNRIGQIKEEQGKNFSNYMMRNGNKVRAEIKKEFGDNVHKPVNFEYEKYEKLAYNNTVFDMMVKDNLVSKEAISLYKKKDNEIEDYILEKVRDTKDNPTEFEKVKKLANTMVNLGKLSSSIVDKYRLQEYRSKK